MYSPAAQGFGRVAANTGLNTLGSLTGRNYERELGLGSTGLKGFAAIQAAKARGRAIEYAGQQAGRSAMFGGLMSGLGSLGGAAISSGMFKGGGGTDATSTLSNPNIPDLGYGQNIQYGDYSKYSGAFTNPNQFYGGTFGGYGF
jgi:hypothetical protein|tara:strand:- start:482 stop:913 length:432 start_codon:yes stop_codon:yes gene_type:complete